MDSVEEASRMCEIGVGHALYYDRRPAGARGRALMYALEGLGLCEGGRLQATPSMPDIGAFDLLDDF